MGLFRATDPAALADAPFNYAEVGRHRRGRAARGLPHRDVLVGRRLRPGGLRAGRGRGLRLAGRSAASASACARRPGGRARHRRRPHLRGRRGWATSCPAGWSEARTEGDERGFSYGTLAGHPESGEERFTVRLLPDGDVVYEIRVFFRLASRAARLAGPLSLRAAAPGHPAVPRRDRPGRRRAERPPMSPRPPAGRYCTSTDRSRRMGLAADIEAVVAAAVAEGQVPGAAWRVDRGDEVRRRGGGHAHPGAGRRGARRRGLPDLVDDQAGGRRGRPRPGRRRRPRPRRAGRRACCPSSPTGWCSPIPRTPPPAPCRPAGRSPSRPPDVPAGPRAWTSPRPWPSPDDGGARERRAAGRAAGAAGRAAARRVARGCWARCRWPTSPASAGCTTRRPGARRPGGPRRGPAAARGARRAGPRAAGHDRHRLRRAGRRARPARPALDAAGPTRRRRECYDAAGRPVGRAARVPRRR